MIRRAVFLVLFGISSILVLEAQDAEKLSEFLKKKGKVEEPPERKRLPLFPMKKELPPRKKAAKPALVINEVLVDPADDSDPNRDLHPNLSDDEFVEIVNVSGEELDISEWMIYTLAYGKAPRHRFPKGTVLAPGQAIVVFGGGEPQGDFGGSIVQIANSSSLRLRNKGDELLIVSQDGIEHASVKWGPEARADQSLVRSPDLNGKKLVFHKSIKGAGDYSPGLRLDGKPFVTKKK